MGAWSNLTPSLDDLMQERSVNVRTNLGMLAIDLAGDDPDALQAFAAMLARTCDAVVRTEEPEDRDVLELLIKERNQADPSQRANIDAACMRELQRLSRSWEPADAVDYLVREDLSAVLAPAPVLAKAALNGARYLAQNDQQSQDREDESKRLSRVARVYESADEGTRSQFRDELRTGLGQLSTAERSLVLFKLLQFAPDLLRSRGEEQELASESELNLAAQAGRSRLLRRLLHAVLSAAAVAGVLTLFAFFTFALSGQVDSDALFYAFGHWVCLLFIGAFIALGMELNYTPSVGREAGSWRVRLRRALPAVALSEAAFFVSLAFLLLFTFSDEKSNNVLGWSYGNIFALFAALSVPITLALLTIAVGTPGFVQYVRDRAPEASPGLVGSVVASLVIAATTIVCGLLPLLGVMRLNAFWAPFTVALASAAVAASSIETETLVGSPQGKQFKDRRRQLAAFVALGFPCALFLAIVGRLYTDWWLQPKQQIEIRESSADISAIVRPGVQIVLKDAAHKELVVEVTVDAPHRALDYSGSPTSLFGLKESGHTTVCVDRCSNRSGWHSLDQWLPFLMASTVRLHISAPQPLIAHPFPVDAIPLNISASTPFREKLRAGAIYAFDLPDGSGLSSSDFTISGKGSYGDNARMLLTYADKDNEFRPWNLQNNSTLPTGKYRICVYFNDPDRNGCDANRADPVIFEKGEAELTISSPPR